MRKGEKETKLPLVRAQLYYAEYRDCVYRLYSSRRVVGCDDPLYAVWRAAAAGMMCAGSDWHGPSTFYNICYLLFRLQCRSCILWSAGFVRFSRGRLISVDPNRCGFRTISTEPNESSFSNR